MDDETFSTESEPWITVHNKRRRRNIIIAGVLLIVASVTALVLGVALYDHGAEAPNSVSQETTDETPTAPPSPPPSLPPSSAPSPVPTEQSLFQFLQEESLFDGSELLDTSSYQHMAYIWLESTNHDLLDDAHILQRFALACIYFATYQVNTLYTDAIYGSYQPVPPWNITANWLTEEDECNWYGIHCNSENFVLEIELYSNSLTGTFPPEVIHMKETLNYLDLFDNVIWNDGDEGHLWLEQLTQLEYLYYSKTFFQYDGIPTYIAALTNLIEFDCSTTLYFGDLKGEIFTNLLKLEYLDIGGNLYKKATVPTQIVNLPDLQYLYLHSCDLLGDLEFVKNLPKIKEFWIDKNPNITGTIPTEIGQLKNTLESFSVTDCALSGSLPTELGLLSNARKLWFSGNNFTGVIPPHIGNITELEILEVYDNQIVGTVPSKICSLVVPNTTVGGNLSSLIVDCELNCTCCTSCQ